VTPVSTLTTHVAKTTADDFAALCQIRSIRRSLPPISKKTGSVACVVKIRLWQRDIDRHSSVSSAPSAVRAQRCSTDHRRPIAFCAHLPARRLPTFEWLRVAERIKFKLAILMFHVFKSRLLSRYARCRGTTLFFHDFSTIQIKSKTDVKRRKCELRPFTQRIIIIILDEERRNLEMRPFDASKVFKSKRSAQFFAF